MNELTITLTLDQARNYLKPDEVVFVVDQVPLKKINFIKGIRTMTNLEGSQWGLKEAKDMSEGKPFIISQKLGLALNFICSEMGGYSRTITPSVIETPAPQRDYMNYDQYEDDKYDYSR
jgi:hypothetical protein